MQHYKMYIDGVFTDAADGETIETTNPYSGDVWATIPRARAADVDRAVASARAAMRDGPWGTMSATERGKRLVALAALVEANVELLAATETRDNGKLLRETRGQIGAIAECWRYYGGLADKIEGRSIPLEKPDTIAFTTREPIGVVAALTAWNSPLWFAAIKCAPAMAAGCAVVVKPSEFASASTLEFAALVERAGIPPGVFNVVTGFGHDVGSALVEHADVAKITFTGSDVTGARVYESAARGLKSVSLELGGKSPNIVFDDANLDMAAAGAVSGIFGASGQMCTAGSRLLVQRSILEEFTERLLTLARAIKLGDPMDQATEVGPVATAPQFSKVLEYVAVAQADGARIALGGKPADRADLPGGQFMEPTVLTGVTNMMRIAQEEVFGPILAIIPFDDEAEAIRIANDIPFGLVGGVWTRDIGRALRMSKALEVGTVWVNTYRAYSYMVPFGGMKRSGLGRESGIEAVDEYLETKSVMISMVETVPENPFIMR